MKNYTKKTDVINKFCKNNTRHTYTRNLLCHVKTVDGLIRVAIKNSPSKISHFCVFKTTKSSFLLWVICIDVCKPVTFLRVSWHLRREVATVVDKYDSNL